MEPKTLGELFDTFDREAFRLETLADYSGSGNVDAYQAFLSGMSQPDDYNESWISELRNHTQRGRRIYRVHILSRPLTPYLRFELGWGYRKNATGGEEFFILDVTDKPNPLTGVDDFWLFDERTPVVMRYDGTGAVTERETLSLDRTQEFISLRDTALEHAEPFPAWWEKHAGS
ncbi:DUF6879 family protein [Streptomyces sp. NBC_00102]|uniref:DUF6879 family protein n=1 Tax=Streptomyces sp. NBC_00102 TaxID=2975652 RepID=UPI002256B92B|nr:DUF6879 family protein [Streptomyces sp. NBC_00102]MCX5398438.1 hypothetical protein [Streptomyces sp. NBC_00102]